MSRRRIVDWVTERWYEFRVGDATYLRFVINFLQFVIIAYALFIPQLPWLKALFSTILMFAVLFVFIYVPLAILFGRYVHRHRQLRKDLMIGATENPVAAWQARVSMEQMITLCEKLDVPVSPEYLRVYKFWRGVDERLKWRAKP